MSEPEKDYRYAGLLGALVEAGDIKQELGISAEEAFAIQRERAEERLRQLRAAEEAARETNVIPFPRVRPKVVYFEDPAEIAERVAEQMGCTVEEALDRMQAFDHLAVLDFCIGNEFPKEWRH